MAPLGSGAGTALNPALLTCAGLSTLAATLISFVSIYLHLKNYRKNILQRMVIRIMIMIPVYAISSFISLFSLQAAFFIDAIRDIYEAFVIYVFFQLLIAYLGGERSLLILLHGRPPVHPLFPLNLFKRDLDASDPYTYLWLKRGILQYVQVKPVLAAATIILKALGKFDEGDLKAGSGYLYISVIYNVSIGIALYCLAMFWVVVNTDLRPFRPMPKFLCVKGILFFSFWQSFFISILVAAGVVTHLGPYTQPSYISLALTDTLICLEMPFFAIAHMYAFSHTDYIDPNVQYAARMPLRYAFRDAFGLKDVVEDSKATLRGRGMDYRAFEPAEGKMHQGSGRDRRIKAGLRYAQGGKQKYWLPMPDQESTLEAGAKRGGGLGAMDRARNQATGDEEEAYAPLFEDQARDVVHVGADLRSDSDSDSGGWDSDGFSLTYSDPHASDDELYEHSRSYLFGDYNYPCIDVSGEIARRTMWDEEERILKDQRAAFYSPTRNPLPRGRLVGEGSSYGATDSHSSLGRSGINGPLSRFKGKDVWNRYSLSEDEPIDEEQIKGASIIDMETERISNMMASGVKMKWVSQAQGTFVPGGGHAPTKPSSSKSPRDRSRGHDSSPYSGSPRSGPSSPRNKPLGSRSSPHAAKALLPHDAVDLVVEDPNAGSEKVTKERRKGEPAVHAHVGDVRALRRVYRREYEARDEEGDEARVEASEDIGIDATQEGQEDEGAAAYPGMKDTRIFRLSEEEHVEDHQVVGEVETVEVTDTTVARATTPPVHARVDFTKYTLEDDNPWL